MDVENAYTPSVTVTNDTAEVSVDENGTLKWRNKNEDSWHTSDLQYRKNGVSNLYVFDGVFVATSFFNIATSNDGQHWNTQYIQVGKKFDPENLISDEEFFTGGTMTVREIQDFLNSHSDCKNSYCLPNYKQYTKNLSGDKYCDNYSGGKYESASEIIYNVSVKCGVSAEVILTTLQKEQALVTADAPSSGELRIAMGYACPDTADCDKKFFGFQQQVYNAAKQFKAYTIDPEFNWFPVGRSSYVEYHAAYSYNSRTKSYTTPTGCGGTNLTIRNKATSALYYYTPYQPNDSAIQNIFGKGDDCGAYGNRNFWRIYNQWFNDTKDYRVFVVKSGKFFYAYDDTGSIARTEDLSSKWDYVGTINMPRDMRIIDIQKKNGKFKAATNQESYYLMSEDGLNWEVKQEVVLTMNEKINLDTREAYYPVIGIDAAMIDGTITISVNGSEYDVITITENNLKLGIITLPSFILNDGTHNIEFKYSGSKDFFGSTVNVQATVGTPKETIYHTVSSRDTLDEIASRYETTTAWIIEANNLDSSKPLVKGSKLKVKYIYNSNMLSTSPIFEQYHTVLPGQSLGVIAAIHGITLDRIKKLNNLANDIIYVGQRIRFA